MTSFERPSDLFLPLKLKVELVSGTVPDALPIPGDRIQIQQVILNLVVNGLDGDMKDTPNEDRVISIRTSRVEKFAELSVSDCGSGIPLHKIKEIFELVLHQQGGRQWAWDWFIARNDRGSPQWADMG